MKKLMNIVSLSFQACIKEEYHLRIKIMYKGRWIILKKYVKEDELNNNDDT